MNIERNYIALLPILCIFEEIFISSYFPKILLDYFRYYLIIIFDFYKGHDYNM